VPLVLAAFGSFVAGVALTAALTLERRESPAGPGEGSASARPPAALGASAEAPRPVPDSPAAARTDDKAVSEIQSRAPTERTAADVLVLAEARAARKQARISELGRKLELVPKLGRDKDTVAALKELAYDREVGNVTLRMLADLKSDIGPDLLYVVWTGTPRKTDSTELAEQLLYSKDVRTRASEALSVALDLRVEENCEDMKKVLERAIQHGDRRSLGPIVRLNNKRGCGEKKLDDCWSCLRDSDLVKNAQKEASKRP
jgi:hypothetical protein